MGPEACVTWTSITRAGRLWSYLLFCFRQEATSGGDRARFGIRNDFYWGGRGEKGDSSGGVEGQGGGGQGGGGRTHLASF